MKFSFVLPYGDARTVADWAAEAEQAGWDGFFVWEPVWGIDAWVSLAAAAMQTKSIRLGTMLTPLSRMRPWKLASETATLDNLSLGRVILAVGLGAVDSGFEAFGEVTDRKARAELMDEGLDILTGLWRGQPFDYSGKHYHLKATEFFPPPPPIQKPRIPIWVVGAWPSERSMRRVVRYDGLLPQVITPTPAGPRAEQATPEAIRAMKNYIDAQRTATTPFEIVVEGQTPGRGQRVARAILQPWREAGATWWNETMWDSMNQPDGAKAVLKRIKQGPPQID